MPPHKVQHATTVRYLRGNPRKVPDGQFVVHNSVIPQPMLGLNGFRAWLAAPGNEYEVEPCDCGWAPQIDGHYRVVHRASAP